MKAIVHKRYGSPDFLTFTEVPTPTPEGDEVRVKVLATTINDWDAAMVECKPAAMRLLFGLFKPKTEIPGCDIAGTVESVGRDASRFQVGDAVYGDIHACGFGGFAEYVCVKESALEPKPERLSFEEAAAVPHAATLAWQGLFDKAAPEPGQRLLINGAGGGVGPIACQLAKSRGLEVTGVDSGEKLALLRSLGFDHVIDYRQQDFTRGEPRYDLILDVKTNRSPFAYARALAAHGTYVTVGGSMSRLLQTLLCGWWIAWTQGKQVRILALKANRGLAEMAGDLETGAIAPVIDGPFALRDLPEAMKYFLTGRQKGRIVITPHGSAVAGDLLGRTGGLCGAGQGASLRTGPGV